MEDVCLSISPLQLETVNSVQMYFGVFMLSEITDSNSQEITTCALDGTATPAPSHLMWPYQPIHTKSTWLIWSKAIQMLYTISPTLNTLQQPLGEWIPNPTRHAAGPDWVACPSSLMLYHHLVHHWAIHWIMH